MKIGCVLPTVVASAYHSILTSSLRPRNKKQTILTKNAPSCIPNTFLAHHPVTSAGKRLGAVYDRSIHLRIETFFLMYQCGQGCAVCKTVLSRETRPYRNIVRIGGERKGTQYAPLHEWGYVVACRWPPPTQHSGIIISGEGDDM